MTPTLIYAVGRVNQGVRREMRARLAGFSLSVQEYTTLSVLDARPGLSNAQLARRALVTPQSMIEILSKLETRKLVRRSADAANARVLRAELTRSGRALLARADPAIGELEQQLLGTLSEPDRDVVVAGMLRMMDRLSENDC